MTKKWIGFVVFARVLVLLGIMMVLSGCSSASDYDRGLMPEDGQNGGGEQPLAHETMPELKIIYTVDMRLDVDDLDTAVAELRAMLAGDEWFDRESLSSRSASFTARIRTERLDAFVATLDDRFEMIDYERTARNISLDYSTQEFRLLAIETEIAALIAMMDIPKTFAEMLLITERLSELDVERQVILGTLNRFDSLVEYSEVRLYLRQPTVVEGLPFGNRIVSAFTAGVISLGAFLQGTVVVFAAVLPFAFFFGVVGGSGFIIYRRIKKRRQPHPEKKGDRLL